MPKLFIKSIGFILTVSCLFFVLLCLPAKAAAPKWRHYTVKFLAFDAPTGTAIRTMPDLPFKGEKNLFADFMLMTNLAGQKVIIHVSCMLRGSTALQNMSPSQMQSQVRAALLSNGPILSSRRFVLKNSKLAAEAIQQNGGKKYVWTILASNRQAGLNIMWGRPRDKEQFLPELIRLANSIRLVQQPPASRK